VLENSKFMRGAFESAGVDMSDDTWVTTFATHLGRCGGGASVHAARTLLVSDIPCGNHLPTSEIRGALGVGIEVLTDPPMLVHLRISSRGA
jgi:hypothetical protein